MGRAVRLVSEDLHVDVLPENGGRIASIRCLHTGTEFLLSGSRYGATAAFSASAPFEVSDCAGWDECLPTVSLSTSDSGEHDAPDHGDLWRHPWTTLEQSENHITLATECFSRPLKFGRVLRVDRASIRLDYSIMNSGGRPEAFLYTAHPLFAVDPGDCVLLPNEVKDARLHYSRSDRLGIAGERLRWPLTIPNDYESNINCAGDVRDGTAEMFYVTSLQHGICALYRPQKQKAVVMRFTHEALPFLGLWICSGGWPEEDGVRKQHAIAMEPTVAPIGSLAEAVASNAAPILEPGIQFNFSIEVDILGCDRPCSREEVSALMAQPPS